MNDRIEERYYKYLLQNAAVNMILNKKNQSIYWNEYNSVKGGVDNNYDVVVVGDDDHNDNRDGYDDNDSSNKSNNHHSNYAGNYQLNHHYNYWLDELRDIICPRIMNRYHHNLFYLNRNFDNFTNNDTSDNYSSDHVNSNDMTNSFNYNPENESNTDIYNQVTATTTATPYATTTASTAVNHTSMSMYSKVLHLLREADASGVWPTTTVARSKVIQTAVDNMVSND